MASKDNPSTMTRAQFLRRSSLGMCGLFLGLNTDLLASSKDSAGKAKASDGKGSVTDSWKTPWQPERPCYLNGITHSLAERSLSGEYGRNLVEATWDFPEINDKTLSAQMLYAKAALSVAKNAPLRVIPGELVIGSATMKEAANWHIPLLGKKGISHTTVGFEKVLDSGYQGLRKEIQERLERGGLDESGTDLLKSMLLVIEAAGVWNQRYIDELARMKEESGSEEEKQFFQTNIDVMERVPEMPPRNFREAVQSLWSLYAFMRIMGNWSGLGRLDRMWGKYLEKDLKEGSLTLDDARELIAHFWIKGTEWFGVPNPTGDAQFYQNVILSGIDKNGKDVTNDVTYLILDVIEELHISDFPTAVRLNARTPDKLYRKIAEVQRFGGGIVSVYDEDQVIKGLTDFGFPLEEAREFTNDGCWEVIIPGKCAFEYTQYDMLEVLTRVLHLQDKDSVDDKDFDSLYARFHDDLKEHIEGLHYYLDGEWKYPDDPCPQVSMFVDGCIEKGLSYRNRGPEHTISSIHYGGIPDVANCFLVIKKLVYDEKYLSLQDFVDILRNNWEGREGLRRTIQNRVSFYGNDNEEADEMMKKVFNDYSDLVGTVKNRDGVLRPCGISTFGGESNWRHTRKASAEGSRIGDILATNCSPSPSSDKKGPTSALNSYCKLDFTRTPNGATLELKALPASVKGENGLTALVALMKTFRSKHGFYLNIDVVDTATLIDAQMHPERYPNLPVRVAGWSARFTTLCKDWQDMIIQRTQQIV